MDRTKELKSIICQAKKLARYKIIRRYARTGDSDIIAVFRTKADALEYLSRFYGAGRIRFDDYGNEFYIKICL